MSSNSVGSFPRHKEPPTAEQLLADGLVAPENDPYRYYDESDKEITIADWLDSRDVSTRSVNTYSGRIGQGKRTPDALAVSVFGTIEFKLVSGKKLSTNLAQVLKGSTQSSRILLYHEGEFSVEEAKELLDASVAEVGAHLETLIVYLERLDTCVFWKK